MSHTTTHSNGTSPAVSANLQGLVWNADLTLQSDSNLAAEQRRQAIDRARASRPRTAQIEREIMIAVIVLYVMILGSFAALHLYGEHAMPAPTEQAASPMQGVQP